MVRHIGSKSPTWCSWNTTFPVPDQWTLMPRVLVNPTSTCRGENRNA